MVFSLMQHDFYYTQTIGGRQLNRIDPFGVPFRLQIRIGSSDSMRSSVCSAYFLRPEMTVPLQSAFHWAPMHPTETHAYFFTVVSKESLPSFV